MIVDATRLTLEVFAGLCEESFGSEATILPNATVLKHCLHLSLWNGGPVELVVYRNLPTMTFYQIGREGLDQQIVGISESDGESIEFANTEEADDFIKELEK